MHGWCPPDSRVYNEAQAERGLEPAAGPVCKRLGVEALRRGRCSSSTTSSSSERVFASSFFLLSYLERLGPHARVLVLERGTRESPQWQRLNRRNSSLEAESLFANRNSAETVEVHGRLWRRVELLVGGHPEDATERLSAANDVQRWSGLAADL